VERRVYTSGKNKVMLDPFQPEKKSDIEHLKSLQAEIHKVFIDMVKQARGSQLGDNDDLFSGMFWTGAQARELGLIDNCGLMGAVIRERYGDKATLKLMQVKRNLFGRPQAGIGVSAFDGGFASSVGAGLAANLPDALLESAEERALWARFGL
jgi:NhaA family Na+:H+ antiporter